MLASQGMKMRLLVQHRDVVHFEGLGLGLEPLPGTAPLFQFPRRCFRALVAHRKYLWKSSLVESEPELELRPLLHPLTLLPLALLVELHARSVDLGLKHTNVRPGDPRNRISCTETREERGMRLTI